jgi:hypothetical protein
MAAGCILAIIGRGIQNSCVFWATGVIDAESVNGRGYFNESFPFNPMLLARK